MMKISELEDMIVNSKKSFTGYMIENFGIVMNYLGGHQDHENLHVYRQKSELLTLQEYVNVGLPVGLHIYDPTYSQHIYYIIENGKVRRGNSSKSLFEQVTIDKDTYNQLLIMTKI